MKMNLVSCFLLVTTCVASAVAVAKGAREKAAAAALQITTEKHPGKGGEWTRIRITGEGAKKLCAALGEKLDEVDPGYIGGGETYSCLASDNGPMFGTIVGPRGELANLEAFGAN